MENVVRVISKAIIISIVIVSDTLIKDCCHCLKQHTSLISTAIGLSGAVLFHPHVSLSLYAALTQCSVFAPVMGNRGSGAGVKFVCSMMGIH